jgi:TolB-like protein
VDRLRDVLELRLSLVVLPFANIGHDPEQDYFADGVTENLTTDLSRISRAFVIGRSTAFAYKRVCGEFEGFGAMWAGD